MKNGSQGGKMARRVGMYGEMSRRPNFKHIGETR